MAERSIKRRITVRIIVGIVFVCAVFFGTAGTFNWPEAWVYMIIQFGWAIALSVFLMRFNPELAKDRLTFMKKTAKSWDKAIIFGSIPIYTAYILLPGLDAVRYQWSKVPIFVKAICFAVVIVSFSWIFWIMKENAYLSRVVEVQKEKQHKVVTTGPYRYVRHPMYAGVIVLLFCLPLALGSLYALIPAAFLTMLFIIRTHLEDKTLHRELDGYGDYAKKTRYRLIPKIW